MGSRSSHLPITFTASWGYGSLASTLRGACSGETSLTPCATRAQDRPELCFLLPLATPLPQPHQLEG